MKIYDKYSYNSAYKDDCERIQKICLSHDIYVPFNVCYDLWDEYSESYSAGWLFLYKSDEAVWQAILPYLTPIEEKQLLKDN